MLKPFWNHDNHESQPCANTYNCSAQILARQIDDNLNSKNVSGNRNKGRP